MEEDAAKAFGAGIAMIGAIGPGIGIGILGSGAMQALALGIILILLAFVINIALLSLQYRKLPWRFWK
ncbi:hypothetical protein ACFLU3_00795 [Chloroflexota bacterium]